MSADHADWNPRYVAYARAHGMTPQGMLAHDMSRPSKMVPFMVWIHRQLARFGHRERALLDHDAFTAFCEASALNAEGWYEAHESVMPQEPDVDLGGLFALVQRAKIAA